MSVQSRLKQIRKSRELNQEEFANILGVSKNSCQRYETGEREIKYAVLEKINKMGYNVNWLISGEGNMKVGDRKYDLSNKDKITINKEHVYDVVAMKTIKNHLDKILPEKKKKAIDVIIQILKVILDE